MPTNRDVSALSSTSAVPVLPATIQLGKPAKVPWAVPSPDWVTPVKPAISASRQPGWNATVPSGRGS